MQQIVEELYKFGATLLGPAYDNALLWIGHLIHLDTIEVPSGTKLETWTVPDEWVVHDALVKLNGEKILDYKTNPLSLCVYSAPFSGTVNVEEFKKHILTFKENPSDTPYDFKFYERDWGFSMPYDQWMLLADGEYEVHIDTEFKPGTMKIGVHTIPGKTDREILLFAHLDHPYQANDNLSGVACLVDLATKIKANHTIKIILCPETIGSIAYAKTQDISKVDAVIAVDICGNNAPIMFQKAFDVKAHINSAAHLALHRNDRQYRKGDFRLSIGSDEYFFNDPKVGIPGILFTTWPYDEYHTSADTPDKIDYKKIEEVQEVIQKTIEIYEKDYFPKREFLGPLMRSKYKVQTGNAAKNLYMDYFFYFMDGTIRLSDLCTQYGFDFDEMYDLLAKLESDGLVSRADTSKKPKRKAPK